MVAVAAGVARFLSVESCGQCTPRKLDGHTVAERLARVSASGGRCYLATQQQVVVRSILDAFPDDVEAHLSGAVAAAEPELIAEVVDIRGGRAYVDERHRQKQPDWTFNRLDSGTVPVERYAGRRPPWLEVADLGSGS